jgi:hypothetical protein
MSKNHNLRDSYKEYKQHTDNPIDIKIYLKITQGFIKFLMSKLLSKGEIMLPERLGNLSISGRKVKVVLEEGKIKGLAPDWKKTKELWEEDIEAKNNKTLVYHFNEETNGIRYKYSWSKNRVLVPNKTLYSLIMSRDNKRASSDAVKKGKEYQIKI